MKIAIPYEYGQVFQHFGRSAQFKIYDAENGLILSSEVVSTNGQGHGALVGFLVQHQSMWFMRSGLVPVPGCPCAGWHPAVWRYFRQCGCRCRRLSGWSACF